MNNSSNILLPSSTVAHHLYLSLNPVRITSAVCLSQPGRCMEFNKTEENTSTHCEQPLTNPTLLPSTGYVCM